MMQGIHESLVETIITHPSVWFGYISQKNKHAGAPLMTNPPQELRKDSSRDI